MKCKCGKQFKEYYQTNTHTAFKCTCNHVSVKTTYKVLDFIKKCVRKDICNGIMEITK